MRQLVLKTFQIELTIPVNVWNELSGYCIADIQKDAEDQLKAVVKQFNADHINVQMKEPY